MKPAGPANTPAPAQAIAFPARTPLVGGRQLHFLFSVRQVVDVLRQVDLQQAPGGPVHLRGMAAWRDRTIPVIDLERCLGLKVSENGMPRRNIVVRDVALDSSGHARDLFALCEVGAAARQFPLPVPCQPVRPPERFPGTAFVHGMYVMQAHLLVVVNLAKMLEGAGVIVLEEIHHGC